MIDSIPLSIHQSRLPDRWFWPLSDDPIEQTHDRPQVVTLCGSTRFVDLYNHFRRIFTLQGMIVLSIELVTTQQRSEDPQHVNRPNKEMLDLLHKRKIDLSDVIFVIDADLYIGDSTRSEIEYAEAKGVPVRYLHDR